MDAATAAEHITMVHRACANVMHLETAAAQDGCMSDSSLRQQLCSLTATLLRSVRPELTSSMCTSILQVSMH